MGCAVSWLRLQREDRDGSEGAVHMRKHVHALEFDMLLLPYHRRSEEEYVQMGSAREHGVYRGDLHFDDRLVDLAVHVSLFLVWRSFTLPAQHVY